MSSPRPWPPRPGPPLALFLVIVVAMSVTEELVSLNRPPPSPSPAPPPLPPLPPWARFFVTVRVADRDRTGPRVGRAKAADGDAAAQTVAPADAGFPRAADRGVVADRAAVDAGGHPADEVVEEDPPPTPRLPSPSMP